MFVPIHRGGIPVYADLAENVDVTWLVFFIVVLLF
jgi:hypothetical protein